MLEKREGKKRKKKRPGKKKENSSLIWRRLPNLRKPH